MKRFMSLLLAFCLLFCFSVSSYAATSDDLANKLYSGWSDTSTPLSGSWYALIKQYFSHLNSKIDLWLPYLQNLGSSTDGDNAYTLVGTSKFLHNVLGNNLNGNISNQLYNIRTLLTTISNSSSSWTSSLVSSLIDKVSSIDSNLSESYNSLVNSESWLSEIYNYSVTTDSYTSSLLVNSNDLKTGWFVYPQLQRPQAKAGYQGSWYFGVLQSLYNFRSDFSITNMTKGRVEGFNDSNFSHLTFSEGLYSMIYRMQQVLADDEDLQMRKDTEENRNAFKNNFLDSSSDNSIKVSDITSVSSLSSGLKQNFDTGVNPLSLFDFLSDESPFSWFTEECKNSMVSVPSSNTYHRVPASSSPYGDYASEHMQDYYNRLEGVKK